MTRPRPKTVFSIVKAGPIQRFGCDQGETRGPSDLHGSPIEKLRDSLGCCQELRTSWPGLTICCAGWYTDRWQTSIMYIIYPYISYCTRTGILYSYIIYHILYHISYIIYHMSYVICHITSHHIIMIQYWYCIVWYNIFCYCCKLLFCCNYTFCHFFKFDDLSSKGTGFPLKFAQGQGKK